MPVARRALHALLGLLISLTGLLAVSSAAGGPLSWVITAGSSMAPGIEPGTLVLLQRRSAYGPGDVVAYRNGDLGSQLVLHRVRAVHEDRLRLQGDANGWEDPYRPSTAEVQGARVLAVPGAGPLVRASRGPLAPALLAGGLALLVLRHRGLRGSGLWLRRWSPWTGWPPAAGPAHEGSAPPGTAPPAPGPSSPPMEAALLASSRRGGGATSPGGSWSCPPSPRLPVASDPAAEVESRPAPARTAAAVGLAVSLLVLGATLLPVTRSSAAPEPVRATVSFAYRASTEPGIVYDDGRVTTGEPVFLDVLDEAVVEADLALDVPPGAEVTGTWRLAVRLEDASGWSTTAWRGPGKDLDQTHHEVRLHLLGLLDLAERASRLTGVEPGPRTLRVVAELEGAARHGGASAPILGQPALALLLEPRVLRLPADSPRSSATEAVLLPTEDDAATRPVPLGLPTVPARALALLAAAACLLLLGRSARPEPGVRRTASLRRRHPGLFVTTGPLRLDGPVVEVDDAAALVRIAQRYERLVLVGEQDGQEVLVVQDDGTSYRCRPAGRAPAAPRDTPAHAAPAARSPAPQADRVPPATPVPGPRTPSDARSPVAERPAR